MTTNNKTMFGPARYKYLRNVVSIRNPEAARGSTSELWREFQSAKTKSKKLRIMRATVLAGNRALASVKRAGAREKVELRRVADIYAMMADRMRRVYSGS